MRPLVFALLLLGACAEAQVTTDAGPDTAEDAAGRCGAPSRVTYSCDPVPHGDIGCRGAPLSYPGTVSDEDTGYPMGCIISFPFCHDRYPDSIAACECGDPFATEDAGVDPIWVCGD